MNTNEIMKMVVEQMKLNGCSGGEIAKMEIAIQYLGDAEFRKKLNDFVFESTYTPT